MPLINIVNRRHSRWMPKVSSTQKDNIEIAKDQIQSTTTLPLSPEEIHEIGLKEVARITAEMEKVRDEVGFKGTLQQFFDHLRTDPKYKMKSREALTARYYEIGKAVDAARALRARSSSRDSRVVPALPTSPRLDIR